VCGSGVDGPPLVIIAFGRLIVVKKNGRQGLYGKSRDLLYKNQVRVTVGGRRSGDFVSVVALAKRHFVSGKFFYRRI
jgi:hypothetical protein